MRKYAWFALHRDSRTARITRSIALRLKNARREKRKVEWEKRRVLYRAVMRL